MSDENKNLDEQLDLLFGTGSNDEPEQAAKADEKAAEEAVGFDAIEDVTELFRKKSSDEDIPDVTLDFSDDDEDEEPAKQEKAREARPAAQKKAVKRSEKKTVKQTEKAAAEPENEERYEFLDNDDEEEEKPAPTADDDEDDYDEDDEDDEYAGRTRRDTSDDQLKKEYTHFWIFTVIVIVLTAAAVLLILNFRGILDFGFLNKETTAVSSETESYSETTVSEEPTTAEITETETEVTETESVPEEETSSEEASSEEETTAAEADASEVLNNYTNMFVVTGTTTLKLRKEPSTDSEVIGILDENAGGEVIDTDTEGWIHVKSNALIGYVSADYVLLGDEAKAVAEANAVLAVRVNADTLNIRAAASTDADILDYTTKDALLTYEGTEESFYKVKNDDNTEGYVSSEFCTLGYYLKEAVVYRTADAAQ